MMQPKLEYKTIYTFLGFVKVWTKGRMLNATPATEFKLTPVANRLSGSNFAILQKNIYYQSLSDRNKTNTTIFIFPKAFYFVFRK